MADPTARAVNRFIAIMNDSNGYSDQLLNVKRKMNGTLHYQPWKVDVLSRPRYVCLMSLRQESGDFNAYIIVI